MCFTNVFKLNAIVGTPQNWFLSRVLDEYESYDERKTSEVDCVIIATVYVATTSTFTKLLYIFLFNLLLINLICYITSIVYDKILVL